MSKQLEEIMSGNVYIAPPSDEDERYLECVADACRRYGIHLSEASETERRFIFDRAEEMLRDKVAV